jgi:hypothetical protein
LTQIAGPGVGKDSNGRYTAIPDEGHELRAEVARKIASSIGPEQSRAAEISGLTLGRRTATTARCSMTYEPSMIVIAQGRKRVELGRNIFICDEPRFLQSFAARREHAFERLQRWEIRATRTAKAIAWIRANYTKPLRVEHHA